MARLISFFSPKGGVGKTFVATNVAVSLAQKGFKTLIIDINQNASGDVARLLGVYAPFSLADLEAHRASGKFDNVGLQKVLLENLAKHSSGLFFLPATNKPNEVGLLSQLDFSLLREIIDAKFDFIVVDLGSYYTKQFINIIDNTDLLLMVVIPDILSIYQARTALNVFESLFLPREMIKIVLNRAESKGGVGMSEIRTVISNIDIIAHIPSDGRLVGHSINFGVPVVIDEPNVKLSLAIKNLAEKLAVDHNLYMEHKKISELISKSKDNKPLAEKSFWDELGFEPEHKELSEQDEEDIYTLKKRVHQKLIEKMELKKVDFFGSSKDKRVVLREKAEKIVGEILSEETHALLDDFEIRRQIVKDITDEALGLGPLEDMLKDDDITDIMVNNYKEIYYEKGGKIYKSDKRFISDTQVMQTIERIIAPLGRRVDESTPMVDARLPDGSRVNAIIPPLSLNGPMLTIRKFGRQRFEADDLVKKNTMNEDMSRFLQACIVSRKNMIISGGTGSGKTTVLNAFSQFIPSHERIITIEDAAELRLHQEHWARLESRPPNIEGKGAITIRDLFRNTLRMRPDRIIIGECRGLEALDMLQAMNTGHDGSLTTVHANSTHDVIARLDSMILMSGIELPIRAIREMIASAIDIVVHTARLSDGTRKVLQITELIGIDESDFSIKMEDIFVFVQTGIDEDGRILGDFSATGYIPSFFDDMLRRGMKLDKKIFEPKPIFYEINKGKR